jgi:hypothetical protein
LLLHFTLSQDIFPNCVVWIKIENIGLRSIIDAYGKGSAGRGSRWYTQVPSQPTSNLANMRMSATVTSTSDSVTLSTGATTMYNRTGDNAVNATAGWTAAEWNIFGDAGQQLGRRHG